MNGEGLRYERKRKKEIKLEKRGETQAALNMNQLKLGDYLICTDSTMYTCVQ
jgi:hypothetical protein